MTAIRYSFLFLPYVAAALVYTQPVLSYLIAWLGSWWILCLTLTGSVKRLPGGRSLVQQLYRPIGLTQIMFAGYTALSSIFFFLDLNGFFYLVPDATPVAAAREFALAAEAQRYYVLIHAAFSTGVLSCMSYSTSGKYRLHRVGNLSWFLLYLSAGLFVAAQGGRFVPGMGQFVERLDMLAMVASVLALAVAIMQRDTWPVLISGALYMVTLVQAFMSGWKGAVVVAFLLLAIFLYPRYKRSIAVITPVVLVVLFTLLPFYADVVRELSWQGDMGSQEAARIAMEQTLSDDAPLLEKNWRFLTGRLSEIGMFVRYIDQVPEEQPFYRFELVENGAIGLVPRIFWANKPNMERLSMERVYELGVVEDYSAVSAKPKFVVDAYLSWGVWGVLLGGLLYGMLASAASRLAERWFGGYLLGSGLVYTALFHEFWTSNSFEFFFNTIFWSFLIMGALFLVGRKTGYLVKAPELVPDASAQRKRRMQSA